MHELFEQKYIECEKSLFLVAVSYLKNTENAKDCVQEATLCAFKAFDKLKNIDFFKTWITRIVINKCKDFLKKERYSEELNDNLGIFYGLPTSELELMDAICSLPRDKSVYIALRFYNDMSYEEVAASLRQPVSTVKYKTKKSLEELKRILEGEN